MGLLELLGNFVTSILVAYLGFTNGLAERIESLLPAPTPVMTIQKVQSEELAATEPKIPEATPERKLSLTAIPKILLEHRDYQRAAIVASKYTDETVLATDTEPLETVIANALVNIYCQHKTEKYIRTTTGTGFFINEKGVILTNAHVAQFLLLEHTDNSDAEVNCVIRTGDPAEPKYIAELLYISPTWIFENANLITEEAPRGTGERDYALLYIARTTGSTPLPTYFPSISLDTELLTRSTEGDSVLTAGYPAESLLRNGADAKLFPVIASTTVRELYTFGSNYADIFSISDSPVGEQGASGGPIVTTARDAIGLIVTKGDDAGEEHSLRALTISYIDRTIIEETGFSLIQNMQGDVAYRGNIFKNAVVPFLAEILEEELTGDAE